MLRLLLTLALIGAAIWLWRNRQRQAARPQPTATASEPMLRCAHCGVHVPQHLAFSSDSGNYCSQAHLQQGPQHREH